MADYNKNVTPGANKPTGFKTRKGANNKTEPVAASNVRDPEAIKRRNSLIITRAAAALIVAIVAGITALIVSAILKGDDVDYLRDNLDAYITLSRDDYTGLEIDIPLVEYSDAMVTAEINKLLVKHKSENAEADGVGITNKPIAIGDVIHMRYRVYTVDEKGNQYEVEGYCNFNDTNFTTIEIGSQNSGFLGFEEALIGVIPDRTSVV